jgi:hypothetical protein
MHIPKQAEWMAKSAGDYLPVLPVSVSMTQNSSNRKRRNSSPIRTIAGKGWENDSTPVPAQYCNPILINESSLIT